MRAIPYERYRWIANSFQPRAWTDPQFENMICGLCTSGVSTVIVEGPNGPIVVTWQRPANA